MCNIMIYAVEVGKYKTYALVMRNIMSYTLTVGNFMMDLLYAMSFNATIVIGVDAFISRSHSSSRAFLLAGSGLRS